MSDKPRLCECLTPNTFKKGYFVVCCNSSKYTVRCQVKARGEYRTVVHYCEACALWYNNSEMQSTKIWTELQ